MMEPETLWRLWSSLGIAICGMILFFLGRAYEASKTKNLRNELKKLRKQNELMEKLKWGEDIKGPNEYEIATQGNPKNA